MFNLRKFYIFDQRSSSWELQTFVVFIFGWFLLGQIHLGIFQFSWHGFENRFVKIWIFFQAFSCLRYFVLKLQIIVMKFGRCIDKRKWEKHKFLEQTIDEIIVKIKWKSYQYWAYSDIFPSRSISISIYHRPLWCANSSCGFILEFFCR